MQSKTGGGRVVGGVAAFVVAAAAVAHPPGDPRPLPAGAVAAGATVTREAGIEFVTITAPGNNPWPGNRPQGDAATGRGRVDYEFRIGRYEVTRGQWSEFFDAVSRVPGGVPFVGSGQSGVNNSLLPQGNISWRVAAIYCNWLHNNKGTTLSAFTSGAYDVSTFGQVGSVYLDQAVRSPGAKFFIPTWDEWLKAAHYDPARLEPAVPGPRGPGQPLGTGGAGWWLYPTMSDSTPSYAPPGVNGLGGNFGTGPGMVNAGWTSSSFPGYDPFSVPLGAYSTVMSPWGLFDAAGGTTEWTESILGEEGLRYQDGSSWDNAASILKDRLFTVSTESPIIPFFDYGFRVAAAVPSPGAALTLFILAGACQARRRAQ